MLLSVLNSDRAIAVNIEIMRSFVRIRSLLEADRSLARKFNRRRQRSLPGYWRLMPSDRVECYENCSTTDCRNPTFQESRTSSSICGEHWKERGLGKVPFSIAQQHRPFEQPLPITSSIWRRIRMGQLRRDKGLRSIGVKSLHISAELRHPSSGIASRCRRPTPGVAIDNGRRPYWHILWMQVTVVGTQPWR